MTQQNNSSGNKQKLSPVTFQSADENPDFFGVKDVAPDEVAALSKSIHLIDVRRPDEFVGELGHAPDSQLMVLDTLPERLEELPKDEPIVFICRSGARSARATAFAQENGFQHVFNMKGGMILWNSLGLKVER